MLDAKFVAASAVALTVTLVAIFSLRPLAPRLGLVDKPNGRKRHRGRVPLIGGLCFFLGTLAGLVYLGYLDNFVVCLLVTGALILLAGLVDDLDDMSVSLRLGIQACAALLVIIATGVHIDGVGHILGGEELRLHALGIPLTILAVVGLMNAFNMLDGIDGLAGMLAMVSIVAIMAFADASWSTLGVILLLQILFVALVPYLSVNLGWPDGHKIFMGDAGSTLVGFLLAWSVIFMSQRDVAVLAPVDVLWCIALPIMDTLAVIVRRVRSGVSPFKADRKHLHHLLLNAGYSSRTTLAIIVGFGSALAAFGYLLRDVPDVLNIFVFMTVLSLYVFRLQTALEWLRIVSRSPLAVADDIAATVSNAADSRLVLSGLGAQPVPPLSSMSMQSGNVIASRWPGLSEPTSTSTVVSAAGEGPGGANEPELRPAVVKVLCVVGASPDAIKIAPILQRLYRDQRFDAKMCVTTLPDERPDQVLRLFNMEPDLALDIKAPDHDPTDITSATLAGMKRVLNEFRPDVVLVHGDTATTLAATLAAHYQHIPVARVEAGPAPFVSSPSQVPDEIDRKITSVLASLHFTPTESAGRELIAAGVPAERVAVIGNPAVDTLRAAVERIKQDAVFRQSLAQRFWFLRAGSPLLLVTHRESISGFQHVGRALRKVAIRRPDVDIVYPIQLTPDAKNGTQQLGWRPANVHLVEPLDYLAFAYLLNSAYLVLTGSSEIQEEAALLGKPVLVLRDTAETSEPIDADNVKQIGIHERAIAEAVITLLTDRRAYDAMCLTRQCSGDGEACLQIIEALATLPSKVSPLAA